MAANGDPLCCCEYYNVKHQRTHLLTFFCECDEFDKTVDDWFKGNPQTLSKFSEIIDIFTDRCRLPWLGGAKKFDPGLVFPPFILFTLSYIASLHFVLTILVFLGLPSTILCCYVFTIRLKMRTRFFLSLSMSSTIGLFLVFIYYIAPFIPLQTSILLLSSGVMMAYCFYLLRELPESKDNDKNTNDSKSCEFCGLTILPRRKHCRICKCCISRYDHHCVWTDCCIGKHNHRIFLCTIVLYLVNIVYGTYISLLFICDWGNHILPDCSLVYNLESTSFIFVCCCYAIISGMALVILLLQQLVLITFNLTSYEWRHIQQQPSCWKTISSSPYNNGYFNNWVEFSTLNSE